MDDENNAAIPAAVSGTTNVVTHADLTEAVRATAVLADLNVSLWYGEKTDKDISARVKEDSGAIGNVGGFVKNLFSGCDTSLKAVRSAYTAARTMHKQLTLPWVSNPQADRDTGARLLPNLLFFRYVKAMSAIKRDALVKLDVFIQEYPDLVVQAKANLALLGKDEDYPEPEFVRKRFKLNFDFSPIPATDGFRNLPTDALEQLGKQLHKKQAAAVQAAQASMWEQVRRTVGHLVDRLDDPKTIFKVNSLDNVRKLLEVLPGFVSLDPDDRLTTVVSDITRMLDAADPKALRGSTKTRMDVVHQAKMVVNKLDNWGL
jgi:hypothetical protein